MHLIGVLVGAMAGFWFATDMDKTLVFYPPEASVPEGDTVILPASSGTGKQGFVGVETLELLNEINQRLQGRTICVSGQRAATMLLRCPFFPSISYWICEGGGRLFSRAGDTKGAAEVVEDESWGQRLYESETSQDDANFGDALLVLKRYGDYVESLGAKVDARGLVTMIRIQLDGSPVGLETAVSMLPTVLEYTFNLGYLDVSLRGINKKTAIALLLRERGGGAADKYLFMGDDDNDILAASSSCEAYIAQPHSEKMELWLKNQGFVDSKDKNGVSVLDLEQNIVLNPRFVAVPAKKHHHGCALLLRMLLKRISS